MSKQLVFYLQPTASMTPVHAGDARPPRTSRLFSVPFTVPVRHSDRGHFATPLAVLPGSLAEVEQWWVEGPCHSDTFQWQNTLMPTATWRQSVSRDCLVMVMNWDEQAGSAPLTAEQRTAVTRLVYELALSQAADLGFDTLLRTWNYLPGINRHSGSLDGYQLFCRGREQALQRLRVQGLFSQAAHPAATAIGTAHGQWQFVFLFLSPKHPFRALENPRQMPAWQYPECYSPSKPAFARAVLSGASLLCSGTASVLGHATSHHDNVRLQCEESLRNMAVLLDMVRKNKDFSAPDLREGLFRVYVRHATHGPIVASILQQHGIKHFALLHGDICRADLLVECEAVFGLEHS